MTDQYVNRQIRIPMDVQEDLKAMALAEDRSVNAQLVHLLRKAIAEWKESSSPLRED